MREGTLPDPANLPDDPALLKQINAALIERIREQDRRIEQLQHQLDALRRLHFGPRSERIDPGQMLMPFAGGSFVAQLPPPGTPPRGGGATATLPAAVPKAAAPAEGHGRQQLPTHLKRVPRVLDVPDEKKRCVSCAKPLVKIGEDTSEQLEYTRAHCTVIRNIRPKYACPDECEECGIVMAPPAAGPIEKGLPGPGLLSYVCVSKYDDHLPLYRQQEIFARQGVHLARQTLCDWVESAADLLAPLVLLMKKRVLLSKRIHTDDIPVPVQDSTREHTREARLWAYLGDDNNPYIVFEYSPSHAEAYPIEFLKDFTGFLQCDAYTGYGKVRATVVGCWAHLRRYFFEAQKSDPERAAIALGFIREFYAVEERAKGLGAPERLNLRQEHSRKAVEALKRWMDGEELSILPQSAIGEAFTYARRQWDRLTRYLEDGDLAIDNNAAERALRGVAVGRKNWLFAGSDEGGRRAAILYSVIESCKRRGVEPLAYLTDVLARIAALPISRLEELLPDQWRAPPAKSP